MPVWLSRVKWSSQKWGSWGVLVIPWIIWQPFFITLDEQPPSRTSSISQSWHQGWGMGVGLGDVCYQKRDWCHRKINTNPTQRELPTLVTLLSSNLTQPARIVINSTLQVHVRL